MQGLSIRPVGPADIPVMDRMLRMFGEAFGDLDTYTSKRPSDGYLSRLLAAEYFIALAALKGDQVVGGLVAYELHKFEQERSEIYIYDLAVAEGHRREGIATALILQLKNVAETRGAYTIFVQADLGDDPAIALYTKVGVRQDVLHFDIATSGKD
jgi:aminoglycoside 3-N-acetyltransferase I